MEPSSWSVPFQDATLRALKPPTSGQVEYSDSLTPGLRLRVGKRTKTFVVLRTIKGKRERITLGRYPALSLGKARDAVRTLAAEKQLGLAAPKSVWQYGECLADFLAGKRKKNKASTVAETERLLKRHFEFSGDVELIDDRQISQALDAISAPSERHHAYVAARTLFNWLVKARRIPHSPLAPIEEPRHAESRDRVLTDTELASVWFNAPETPYGQIVRLVIITGQRPGQIGGLRGEFIDPAAEVITWPAEHMKGNRRHSIPLTKMAAEILRLRKVGNSYQALPAGLLFPTKYGNSFGAWARNKERLDAGSGVSNYVHQDLRRTWATKAADWEIADPYIIELVLAHQIPGVSQVGPVYNRAKYLVPIRAAFERFEHKLLKLVEEHASRRVVAAA